MDVTCANVRREYATPRTLWVEVIGLGVTFLVICETVRRLLASGAGWPGLAGSTLVLAGAGWLASRFVSQAVRRASFEAELWRKFGLDQALLDAVAAVPPASPAGPLLDRALRALRSLAAVGNHAAWERLSAEPHEELAARAEALLTATLTAPTLDEAALARLAAHFEQLAEAQRAWLAEGLRGDEPAAAAAAAGYHTAWAALQPGADRAATEGDVGR
ncbi:MAG: hypothetical protein IT204_05890 [Fimbriimonadaceae bacterium]|nr:hypothetical protein [Fimbriimonadaceae bacterium]